MSSGSAPSTGHAVTLTTDNTFSFLPGAMAGVACPVCFTDQLLQEVIQQGECTSCGSDLEVTLTATES